MLLINEIWIGIFQMLSKALCIGYYNDNYRYNLPAKVYYICILWLLKKNIIQRLVVKTVVARTAVVVRIVTLVSAVPVVVVKDVVVKLLTAAQNKNSF